MLPCASLKVRAGFDRGLASLPLFLFLLCFEGKHGKNSRNIPKSCWRGEVRSVCCLLLCAELPTAPPRSQRAGFTHPTHGPSALLEPVARGCEASESSPGSRPVCIENMFSKIDR